MAVQHAEKNEKQFAIIKTGGKQYKVSLGDLVKVEKLTEEKNIEFVDLLNGSKVTADIVGQGKLEKVKVYKQEAKKGSRSKNGHRQAYTEIKITKIG